MTTSAMETSSLNPEQLEAAHHKEGPLLVLAGAGSGKTRVVTERIAYLLEEHIPSHAILGLTFTNKAAEEMMDRVRKKTAAFVLISTFHSLGARLLREFISHLGYHSNFSIYDEEDSLKLLRDCGIPDKKGAVNTIREQISKAKNDFLSPSDVEDIQLQQIYSTYQLRLKEANAVDFDDLLFLPVKLLSDFPTILQTVNDRWKYILIDEYQDTNHAQYKLVRLLAGEKQNIFAVGDPDQSIYSWRGATIRNILHFKQDFPNAKVIRLEQNYRSRSNILQAANALITHNSSRLEKNLWSDRGVGAPIQLYEAPSEREEAEYVMLKIRKHREAGIPLSEMAIFYRTNFQSRVLEDYLLYTKTPYTIVGGLSFYQRLEIKDILAFLRMVQSSSDLIAFMRTLHLPKRGIGPTTIEKLRSGAVQEGLAIFDFCQEVVDRKQALKLTKGQLAALESYVRLIQQLRHFSQNGSLTDLVTHTVEKTHYNEILREDADTFEDRRDNVRELVSKATEWESRMGSSSLTDFLAELTLKSTLDQSNMSEERIKLMTIHNSKGLEFDVVFIVGLEEDLLPHANSKEDSEMVEEERRLCYVGITRAKEQLYLTRARNRILWGMLRTMNRSRFLYEIPREHVNTNSR